jgi:pimeloyl-ACP methyl ester carboxylesterase
MCDVFVSGSGTAYPNLVHLNKVATGGHFAAWEQPKIFTDELRAGFKSLRG